MLGVVAIHLSQEKRVGGVVAGKQPAQPGNTAERIPGALSVTTALEVTDYSSHPVCTCHTVEPLYCGHLTWGPGGVSCIERCPHFRNPSIVDTW